MNKITKLEYSSTSFLSFFALFLGIGISNIIETAENDTWISLIIGSVLGLLLNYLISKINKNNNNFFTIIYSTIILSINTMVSSKLIASIYLSQTPEVLIMIPFLLIIYYLSTKDNNTIYKVSNILSIIYLLLLIIPIISLIPNIDYEYFIPIKTNSNISILKASFDFAIISTIPLIVVEKNENFKTYKPYLLFCFFISIIIICTIGNLGSDLIKIYRYPEYMVFKNISILHFIENIENILFFIWIINTFTLSSQCAIRIKKSSNKKILLLCLLIVLLITNYLILNNYLSMEFIIHNYTIILSISFLLFIISNLFKKKV